MTFVAKSGGQYDWWVTYRSPEGATNPGDATVADIVAGDYLPGNRATVDAVSGTNPRSVTLSRLDKTWTVSWPSNGNLQIIR